MTVLSSTLKLSLLDGVTGKARGIGTALSGINKSVSSLTSPLRSISGQLIGLGAGYLAATVGLQSTYTAAANMQAAMTEIGIKSGLSSQQLGILQSRMTSLAPKVNQTTTELVGAMDAMLTMGLGAKEAEGAIPAIGKAATATGASITDLATASVSAIQNLKVLPSEIGRALDGMAAAGNAGAFELKDMAQYVPALGAAYQGLGQKGVGSLNDLAAALQIVRMGTGDSASAATNLENVLQKINSPQTVKAFKSMGVNLSKELSKASKKGLTPIEAIAEITNRTLKGNLSKLGDLFQDAEVQKAMRPLIQNMDQYRKIRDEANAATGTVDAAYVRRMQDNVQKTKAFQISVENLGVAIGGKLLGPVGKMADELSNTLNTLDSRFGIFDRIKASIEGLASGSGAGGLDGIGKKLNDFVFGIQDGSKAADQYGAAFKRFYEYGQSIKSFTDSLDSSPITKFMTELGLALAGMGMSKYFRLFAIAAGIKAVVDAARDAKSITEFVDNLKGLSALEWAGVGAGLLMVASRASKVIALFKTAKAVAPVASVIPEVAPAAAAGLWGLIGRATGLIAAGGTGLAAATTLGGHGEVGAVSSDKIRAMMDAQRAGYSSAPTDTNAQLNGQRGNAYSPLMGAVDGANSVGRTGVVRIDASSISAMTTPSGVQQVAVTNLPKPVEVKVSVVMNNTFSSASDPAAAAAMGARVGAEAKAAVESSFGGGGGF